MINIRIIKVNITIIIIIIKKWNVMYALLMVCIIYKLLSIVLSIIGGGCDIEMFGKAAM